MQVKRALSEGPMFDDDEDLVGDTGDVAGALVAPAGFRGWPGGADDVKPAGWPRLRGHGGEGTVSALWERESPRRLKER